ncbi:MAG: DUF5926 family protein [Bifidobacteriaceae bacterium]|jgi:hypothetical protein|nr:DUF5926 family protein [Bifidobacteriaceae bacterium]
MAKHQPAFVARPLADLTLEADLVAMREILPAARAVAGLSGGGIVQFVTLLPELARAWRKTDGLPVVALQPPQGSDDVSRDLGNALTAAMRAAPGQMASPPPLGADGPRLQDLLTPNPPTTGPEAPSFELLDSFDYWTELDPEDEPLAEAAKNASADLVPTLAVPGLERAYWTKFGEREYLRWSLGVEEEALLDALARLQAERQAGVIPGAKYLGAFRALGLVIPVWDLPAGTGAEDLSEPAAAFRDKLETALADTSPLDANQRRARHGLVARSLTLR